MTRILAISRPRFWIYVFGPYIVGLAAGATSSADLLRAESMIFGLYFLLPANLLVYGINDIYDFETDIRNPKKADYEMLVRPEMHRSLWKWIAVLNTAFIIAAIFLAPQALPFLLAFILLSIYYSAPPARAKEVAFLDSIFNILYVLPGAFAYQLLSGELPPAGVIFAGALWTGAMHGYSAIPDIEADTAARMETIATKFGSWGTHFFCLICFGLAGFIGAMYAPPVALLGFVYVVLMRLSISDTNHSSVFSVYRWFPVINAICGFLLFWYVAWSKFL